MAGNQLPVLTLDFSDEKIQKLQEIADKFKNAFSIGPGGIPVVTGNSRPPAEPKKSMPTPPGNSTGENSAVGRERDEKGRFVASGKNLPVPGNSPKGQFNPGGVSFGNFFQDLDKASKGTLKTFTLINKTLGATTNTLKGLFTTTISWGARLAAISVAGPFGYGYMAHRATEQYKTSQGLGVTTGQMQAAKNVYGSRISGTGNILQSLAAAQNDPRNPEYAGIMSLGINPQNGAAQNLPLLMERVASLLSQYKETGVSQTVLNSRGLGGIIDVATANQLLANSDRLPELSKQYQAQSNQLDRNMGTGTQQSYQDLSARFAYNADRIGNSFLKALSGLSGPIGLISDNLTTSIDRFLNGRNGKALFDTLANGLQKLGNWLGGDDFQTDLNTFADCVKAIVIALGHAIKWIAGNVPGADLSGSGVGPEGANSAYVKFGDKYLGGQMPGANPLTNQYTGEYFKEEDVSSKYQMPDALKTNVQTFVEAANKTANLPDGLMSAIAQAESSWNPLALNKASGAAGLFQFIPSTAKAYGLEGDDVYDPNKSTVAAGRYLNDLNKRYKGDVAKMLTSYNGGKIDKDGNLSLKKETVDYLIKILPQVQGAIEQHPGIMWQLSEARSDLSKGGKEDRSTIRLQVDQKPGSDIQAQVQGIYVTPR
ncbi:lytic transglycosylase domain-containing protein [Yokenella regensburgei]|uniref:lytic transglycosylase domain-containing protein n=1 Tax=Yokenella regensburgei TaxID=158877 RepID=UPI003ED885B1